MNRPPLEVADVIRAVGPAFLERARVYFDPAAREGAQRHSALPVLTAKCQDADPDQIVAECGYARLFTPRLTAGW